VKQDVRGYSYNSVQISMQITADANKLLTQAAQRSGRSKTQEAKLRLHDHLEKYQSISEMHKTVDRI
tara:strand:- start:841 stop:1041 length:201 start_codon:yes stop_codon:yes gene_type:complete